MNKNDKNVDLDEVVSGYFYIELDEEKSVNVLTSVWNKIRNIF